MTGSNSCEHGERLCEVLKRLEKVGLKLHPTKCSFGVDSVQYLGYTIDATGLKPTKEKLDAILNAPEPKDSTQLRSYLGMLNFYRKFPVSAAAILEPLNALFATLGGNKIFPKLDMKIAYNQLLLNPESQPLTIINTQRGLFQYNRLSFGVVSAPGIFQRTIKDLLRGIPGVCVPRCHPSDRFKFL